MDNDLLIKAGFISEAERLANAANIQQELEATPLYRARERFQQFSDKDLPYLKYGSVLSAPVKLDGASLDGINLEAAREELITLAAIRADGLFPDGYEVLRASRDGRTEVYVFGLVVDEIGKTHKFWVSTLGVSQTELTLRITSAKQAMHEEMTQQEIHAAEARAKFYRDAVRARRAVRVARALDLYVFKYLLRIVIASIVFAYTVSAGGWWSVLVSYIVYVMLGLLLTLIHDIALASTRQSLKCSSRIGHKMPVLPAIPEKW
jgi:hypothetical protein